MLKNQGVIMLHLSRFVMALLVLAVLAGCAMDFDSGPPPSRAEEWTGIDADTFVDKDTHMRKFYKAKISHQEDVIKKNTKELEKLSRSNPTAFEDIMHDAMKKDRLEREIVQAKKSKRNWEKVEKDYIKKQEGSGGSEGGGGGGCGS